MNGRCSSSSAAIERQGHADIHFTTAYTNPKTGYSLEKLTPQHFSFNTHLGACPPAKAWGASCAPDPA
jgi:excinuclease ABC subunit A